MPAYYNENDPYAAQWLRNLIAAGHIADGDVDERSIADVRADDLSGLHAMPLLRRHRRMVARSQARRIGPMTDLFGQELVPASLSHSGAGKAADDERHLWPAWFPLIAERRPATVFGEQVEAAIGWGWLDAVFADLEGEGYACGAAVLPACGVGAPHIRQRLWFVADAVVASEDAAERRMQGA